MLFLLLKEPWQVIFSGAALELASGAASTIPGVGTGISVGLDAALIAKDTGAFNKKETVNETTSTVTETTNSVNIEKPLLKNDITKLEDPKPTVIDMSQNKGSNTQVSQGSQKLSTNIPNISSSDPDNTFTLYSQTQYNMVV